VIDLGEHDIVVVGGGTAGAVVASRLSEDAATSVCLIEGGPSDVGDDRVLRLASWLGLLGSELDYDYPIIEQERGNSLIRQARGRVLGGCSSHNTMISFLPLPADLDEWEVLGATGLALGLRSAVPRLRNYIVPVAPSDRNPVEDAFIATAARHLGVPVYQDFNAQAFVDGVGYFSIGYDPKTGIRSSSSVAYLHHALQRPNLEVLTETRAMRLVVGADHRVTGVEVRPANGPLALVRARREVVLSAGAIDSPRLLMLSGIGPAPALSALGIDVVADLPGVGENLRDHPESVITWATVPLPAQTVMGADAGLFVRRHRGAAGPDLMFHFCVGAYDIQTAARGYPSPEHAISLTPNVPKPRSVGRMWLGSPDPDVKPELDFRYFSDPDGYDEKTILDGLKLARRLAAAEPLASWVVGEVAPGPDVTDDESLSAYGRSVSNTVYHPCGTCRMGPTGDRYAVVGPELRVHGLRGLRVADASVLPTVPAVNPMVTVLLIGEYAASLV